MNNNNNGLFQKDYEYPFVLAYSNHHDVLISFGPEDGILWRGQSIIDSQNLSKISLLAHLNNVFHFGFTQYLEQSIFAELPYIKYLNPMFICASSSDPFGIENEEISANRYGYVYMIDSTVENKIHSVPLCEDNISNPNFSKGYLGEIVEGPDYVIISKFDVKHILGAIPTPSVVKLLGINEKSFIKNPKYSGSFLDEDIKKITEVEEEDLLRLVKDEGERLGLQAVLGNRQAKPSFFHPPQNVSFPYKTCSLDNAIYQKIYRPSS
ncbi:MAG: hypothetical protein RLY40_266 [Pseudomonadota bacterium]|jgi:hypothetical protein